MEQLLQMIDDRFAVTELDTKDFASMKVSGMNFQIRSFQIENVGTMSVMSANGFFGLMKMDTFILVPTKKDAPLFSYDRIFAMGNDTCLIELYNTQLSPCNLGGFDQLKARSKNYPAYQTKSYWYDELRFSQSMAVKSKKKQSKELTALRNEYFMEYLRLLSVSPECDESAKKEKCAVYVNGLLTGGGASTSVFLKNIGKEKTEELFHKYLFGV